MKSIPSAILFLCLTLAGASGENPVPGPSDPDAPRQWIEKSGKVLSGKFLSLSGDKLMIVRDGREFSLSMTFLSDESARQARKLAGMSEPLTPIPVARPLPMKFESVIGGQLNTRNSLRTSRFGPKQVKSGFNNFNMGSPEDEPGRESRETLHKVRITRGFHLKATEVTWDEWNSVRNLATSYGYMDLSPGSNGQGGELDGRHPVLGITWWDAIKWCNLLSQIENRTPVYYTNPSLKIDFVLKSGMPAPHVDWVADGYRLPTEAEWEFACRSDTSTRAFHTGDIRKTGMKDTSLEKAGWFGGNSGGGTHPVGGKTPNRFGLYDMHGNAAEWCWDIAGELTDQEASDPRGATAGQFRIIRGGSWLDPAEHCRAAYRGSRNPAAMPNPSVGFRPLRVISTDIGR